MKLTNRKGELYMYKMKAAMAVLLSAVLVLTVFLPAVGAQTVTIRETRTFQDAPAVPEGIDADIDWEDVRAAIEAGISAHEETIDISAFGIAADNADNVEYIANIVYHTPKLLGNSVGFSRSVSGNTIVSIDNHYVFSADEFAAMYDACEDAVTQLLYGIRGDDALTDAEKCLLVHDRLAAWCEYDYENLLAGTVPDESYSAYGPLVLHTGVCQGISYAFDWMMDELGIEDCYVSSETLGHGWNMVTIDGEEYFIDNTFDDPVWDVPGNVRHENLLVSADTFAALHDEASDYTDAPDSALYENAWWTSLRTGVQYIDGAFWYIRPSTGGDESFAKTHFDIVKRLPDGTETVKKTAEAKWTTASGSYYRSEMAMLTSVGGELIYMLPDEVRSYDTETGEDTLVYAPDLSAYGADFHLYGMSQLDGTLTLVVSDSPNFDADTKENTLYFDYCTGHENREMLADGAVCTDCRAFFPCTHSCGAWTVLLAPTCTVKGLEKRTCENCRGSETRETPVDKTKHGEPVMTREPVAATCTAAGRTGEWSCPDCGAVLTADAETPKTAHDFRPGAKVEPTCTKGGYTVYKCSACSATENRDHVSALGHDYDENGVCSRCGDRNGTQGGTEKTSFFQRILDFFRKIVDFFKNLFN